MISLPSVVWLLIMPKPFNAGNDKAGAASDHLQRRRRFRTRSRRPVRGLCQPGPEVEFRLMMKTEVFALDFILERAKISNANMGGTCVAMMGALVHPIHS